MSVVVSFRREPVEAAPERVAEHVGRRLRRRRRVMGLTQDELARACGLKMDDIQKYETAAVGISESRLQVLAKALLAPVSYFYAGLDEAVAAAG